MKTINFLQETKDVLAKHGKKVEDIYFITYVDAKNSEISALIQSFIIAAEKIDYNRGIGYVEINPTLKVVGKDWWLERATYDGAEWWEFKALPRRPSDFILEPRLLTSEFEEDE